MGSKRSLSWRTDREPIWFNAVGLGIEIALAELIDEALWIGLWSSAGMFCDAPAQERTRREQES
jgi:hypothetical protein